MTVGAPAAYPDRGAALLPPLAGADRPRLPRVAVDTETHLTRRGYTVPRVVCMSLALDAVTVDGFYDAVHHMDGQNGDDEQVVSTPLQGDRVRIGALLTGRKMLLVYRRLLEMAADGQIDLVMHHAVWDLCVLIEAAARCPWTDVGPLLELTVAVLDAGGVRCTLVREKLIAIAKGKLKGAPRGYFALSSEFGLARRYLGIDRREEKKQFTVCTTCDGTGRHVLGDCGACEGYGAVGPWRMRYCQLDGVPLTQWPDRPVIYAIGDCYETLDACHAQEASHPVTEVGAIFRGFDDEGGRVRNGHVINEEAQLRAGVSFAAKAAWGVCVDPPRARALDAVVTKIAKEANAIGVRAGFVRDFTGIAAKDPQRKRGKAGSKCTDALHALIIEAFGYDEDGNPLAERKDPSPTEIHKAAEEGREPVGNIKADRDTLMSSGHPDLIAYAERGAALKLATTYVPILHEGIALGPIDPELPNGPHGPITSRANDLLVTGRAGWSNPNWTNPPREGGFRECVIPRPGHVFVTADYSTIEFWAWGQVCSWLGFGRTVVDVALAGIDPHLDFASDLMDIPYDLAKKLRAEGDKDVKARRQVAKVANYGFPGGMGAKRFVIQARNQGVILDERHDIAVVKARELHHAFREKWPEAKSYFAWVGSRVGTREQPKKYTARQFVSGRLRGRVGYCDGCNTYFQGLVADGAKDASWNLFKASRGLGPFGAELAGCRPVLFLHDELIIEVPCGDGTERYPLDAAHLTAAADALARLMVAAMQPYIPDIPIEAEAAAMLRWQKGPDPRFVDTTAGRVLVPTDFPDEGVLR